MKMEQCPFCGNDVPVCDTCGHRLPHGNVAGTWLPHNHEGRRIRGRR